MATSEPTGGARSGKRGGRHHEPIDERVEIDLDEPVELVVNNVLGDIAVRATDRPDVRIRADRAGADDRAPRLHLEVDGNRIHVHGGATWSFDLGLGDLAKGLLGRGKPGPTAEEFDVEGWERGPKPGRGTRCDVLIEVPLAAVEARAKLRAAAGDVIVEGLVGEVGVGAASGEIALRRLSGTIAAQTASGDIEIAEVDGEVRARSASGDVRISRADLEGCTLQTASGDIQVHRTRLVAAGPVRIDTVSGDARLDLGLSPAAGEQGAILEYKTVSGDIEVSPPFASVGKRVWRVGAGGEGCARLIARSVSGDLSVKLALDVAESPLPPGPPRPPRPQRADRDQQSVRGAIGGNLTVPEPPVPPTPPTPPSFPGSFGESFEDAEEAMRDAEEALDDARRAIEDAGRDALEAEWQTLEADRPLAAAAPSPTSNEDAEPVGDAVDPERLEILTALERGEIDIDEAMRRLEPLGGDASDLPSPDRPEDR